MKIDIQMMIRLNVDIPQRSTACKTQKPIAKRMNEKSPKQESEDSQQLQKAFKGCV